MNRRGFLAGLAALVTVPLAPLRRQPRLEVITGGMVIRDFQDGIDFYMPTQSPLTLLSKKLRAERIWRRD